jgi:diadenosine tetraphosphatase ApaH/serine/threonine PP2A family protein phosphatase
MRMLGDMRYVSPGEYAAFVTPQSEAARETLLRKVKPDLRDRVRAETPLGRVEMEAAFGPDGEYGRWLRGHSALAKINGILFLHGGISPGLAALACDAVNTEVRRELTGDLDLVRAGGTESLVTRDDGPLWYRGLAQEPDTFEPAVAEILSRHGARAIVVGHTVVPGGRVAVRFGGKVVEIDTGMLAGYVPGGRASALDIRGDTMTAIYTDRRDVLTGPAATPSP